MRNVGNESKTAFYCFPFIMLEPFGAVVDCRSLFLVYYFEEYSKKC